MPQQTQKTILFCPLDWGLGHIARDLPLIKEFKRNGHHVIVAASEKLCSWIKNEDPNIGTAFFDGPQIHYSGKKGTFSEIFFQLPRLIRWPGKEKKRIKELINLFHPTLIISDNRYGARHPDIHSIIITHQLCIQMPKTLKWAEYFLHLLVKILIEKFDQCWIPDFPKQYSLAGNLVHQYPLPASAVLIGPLSRFDGDFQKSHQENLPKAVLGIISGPEPQRSIFEELLKKNLEKKEGQHTLITGQIKNHNSDEEKTNPKLMSHQPTQEMIRLIQNHRVIISRSGYSTIMDMYFLNRSIIMVPTPGQTEQEYLAQFHQCRKHIKINQSHIPATDFCKIISISQATSIRPKPPLNFRSVLKPIFQDPSKTTKFKKEKQQKKTLAKRLSKKISTSSHAGTIS